MGFFLSLTQVTPLKTNPDPEIEGEEEREGGFPSLSAPVLVPAFLLP
jgi:hypothetical protein